MRIVWLALLLSGCWANWAEWGDDFNDQDEDNHLSFAAGGDDCNDNTH